jgi:exodeoxyribonuclease VIII
MFEINWQDYCELKRMNASTIVHGAKSMLHLKRAIDGGFPEETDAMRLGTGIHALLLEPDEFESRFVVMPAYELDADNLRAAKRKDEPIESRKTKSKATNYYEAKVDKFIANNSDRTILTRKQYDQALHCIESISSRPYIVERLKECEREVTLLGSVANVPFKGRLDLLRTKRPLIIDLKTTANIDKHAFGRTFMNLQYDWKLAIYRELATQQLGKRPDVAVITVEPSGDYDCAYVPVPEIVLDNAWSKVLTTVGKYIQAKNKNEWPGVDGGKDRYELAVPNWAMDDDEEMDWSQVPQATDESTEVYF